MVEESNKRNKIIAICIIVIGILIIAISLFFYFNTGKSKNYTVGDLTQEVKTASDEGRNLVSELNELNKNYKEAVAWLKIPGTSIDTAVFQAEDNDKYIRTDRDGNETRWGENFLDYTCDLSSISKTMQHYIIYGHNTEVDTRFTPLLNYKEKDFYKDHQLIELATNDNNYTYQIFSVYKTNTDFYYIENDFENDEDYSKFLKEIKNKSEYNTGVEVTKDDNILTLSTCDYSIDDGRYVVHAKLVKEKNTQEQ